MYYSYRKLSHTKSNLLYQKKSFGFDIETKLFTILIPLNKVASIATFLHRKCYSLNKNRLILPADASIFT